jgi:hypothetical protein
MMRKVNADSADRDVHLSSSAPASVHLGYHKIRGSVKKGGPTATSWCGGKTDGIAEKDHI